MSGGTEKLSKMWYIPHITEIIVGMARPEKIHKGPIDLGGTIFKNNQSYLRSYKVHCLIEDIFSLMAAVSSLLQGNQKNTASIVNSREVDYTVNSLSAMKRDFQSQGDSAEFSRVLKGLFYRWQFWTIKWKYMLSVCVNCLEWNFLSKDAEELQYQFEKSISTKQKSEVNKCTLFRKPLKLFGRRFGDLAGLHTQKDILASLSTAAKSLCSFRLAEIEEDLEDEASATQAESRDDAKQKVKIDSVLNGLRTFRLKKEFLKSILLNRVPFKVSLIINVIG